MTEELDKYIDALKKSFTESLKDFAENEEVKAFFSEQAALYGKEFFAAERATSPEEKKEHEDNLVAITAQNKSEVRRLVLAADNVVRAKLEGILEGAGNVLVNLIRGGIGA